MLFWRAHVLSAVRVSHYGAQGQETDLQKARRVLHKELQRLGLTQEQLLAQRKGSPAMLEVARRLRRETAISLKWIAERPRMGSWTYVSNLIRAKPIYGCTVRPGLLVQPSLQYIVNPGGNRSIPNALAVGINLVFKF